MTLHKYLQFYLYKPQFMDELELPYVTLSYKAPIVYITFKENVELGIPEIQELTTSAEKLSGYKPYVVLSDVKKGVEVTKEGRKLAANNSKAPLHRGTAVLVKNAMISLAANFFSAFEKPVFPYKAFTSKQEAVDWLMKLPLEKS